MTEAEWLACTDPVPMLDHLMSKMSQRKIRLFACALARRLWSVLVNKRSRKAIVTAERHADGLATGSELVSAQRIAQTTYLNMGHAARAKGNDRTNADEAMSLAATVAAWAALDEPFRTRCTDGDYLFLALVLQARLAEDFERKEIEEYGAQANLLRDLIGNPFRSFVVAPSWLRWHDGLIERMSQEIYDERHFVNLPILADALEEAGCDNADILNHCRNGSEHVRGCWVIDLLLGKT